MKTIDKKSSKKSQAVKTEGFTLLELLVVLVVIAVLIAIQLPVFASTKGQSRQAQCAANLKQFCVALHMFGGENNDKLPVNSGGFWAWDLTWSAGNSVTQYVSFKKLYCPGTSVRFTDQDNANLWNWTPGNLHIPGYLTTLPGTAIIATNQNASLTPQRILSGSAYLPAPSPAARVLVADATISGSSMDNHAGFVAGTNYNFTSVNGGYPVPHISPHLNGLVPAGGNLGMLDGHVEWRKFADMDERASLGAGFWW